MCSRGGGDYQGLKVMERHKGFLGGGGEGCKFPNIMVASGSLVILDTCDKRYQ